MKPYFHVPELDLTKEQRSKLFNKFKSKRNTELFRLKFEKREKLIYNLSTYYANINFISEFFTDNLLNDIKTISSEFDPNDKWGKTSSYEFMQTTGPIEKHCDKVRHATIIIPLYDPECNKLEWWNKKETKIIDTLDYKFKTWILNVKRPHSMLTASKTRISFQASIYGHTFDEVKKMYDSGKLFKNQ